MLRALLWKEWRQLALVRWGGMALGAALPIAFTAGAELSRRGLLPTGRVQGHASRDLILELLPAALSFGLWPLIALVAAASSFAGDRAAGTESFLLERPVPRAEVWRARLLASSGSLLAVIGATGLMAALFAAFTGMPPGTSWARWAVIPCFGFGLGLMAYLGGVVAASLLASPLGALLLGALLAGIPIGLAAQLATLFPNARYGNAFLGLMVPLLMLPAYGAASWLSFCRGEPAGRGRVRRAVVFLVAAFAGDLAVFVVLAPLVLRANASIGQHSIYPAPSGKTAFVGSTNFKGGAGWIVDVASAKKLSFIAPPIEDLAFSSDGSRVAISTWSGPLGSERGEQRIDVFSTANGNLLRSIPVPGDGTVWGLTWADNKLVAVVARIVPPRTRRVEIEIVDPGTGVWRSTGFRSEGWSMGLAGPTDDGRVFARLVVNENFRVGAEDPRGYRLYPIDATAARVGPSLADAKGRELNFAGWFFGLSPGGRFARVVGTGSTWGEARLVDLTAGADVPDTEVPLWARWIPGDRRYWSANLDHRTRMFVAAAGQRPQPLREWTGAAVHVDAAPGGRACFVSVLPEGSSAVNENARFVPDLSQFAGDVPAGAVPEELVYLTTENRFVRLGPPFSDRANDLRYTLWAGSGTLARIAPGVVYLEDIDAPGTRRFVIGGPSDLE